MRGAIKHDIFPLVSELVEVNFTGFQDGSYLKQCVQQMLALREHEETVSWLFSFQDGSSYKRDSIQERLMVEDEEIDVEYYLKQSLKITLDNM